MKRMKRKHRRTLAAIYDVQANLDWADIEALFVELGADVRERAGSRVRFRFPDGTRRSSTNRTPPARPAGRRCGRS